MLVRRERDRLRLMRQLDHSLASGALAAAWIGPGPAPEPIPFDVVVGIALHDLGWAGPDATPRLDPDRGAPHDFTTLPLDERLATWAEGIEALERIGPHAAWLASRHFGGFGRQRDDPAADAFCRAEEARRERIRRDPAWSARHGERTAEADLRHLRLFDDLSLFACLTGPGARDAPDWLGAEAVGRAAPAGALELDWTDPETIAVDPFPFRGPVLVEVPTRDLPPGPFEDEATLHRAWADAPAGLRRVRWVPRA